MRKITDAELTSLYKAEVKEFGEERARNRYALRAERERMRDGHDYPFEGCTEPELTEWFCEYVAEFGCCPRADEKF
jgi:hypothetical protein